MKERKFCVLECIFGSGHLLLTLHNQLLESLHRSSGPIVNQVVVGAVPVGNIGLNLAHFSELFHFIRGDRNLGFGIRYLE